MQAIDKQQHAVVRAGVDGRALRHLGALLHFKALGVETGGQFWAVEGLADRHMAVPLHAHSREDEIWYVLEGTIRFTIGNETRRWPRDLRLHPTRGSPYLSGPFGDGALVRHRHARGTG